MKKLIFILSLFMTFALNSFAEEKREEIASTETVKATFSEIKAAAQELTEALKTPAAEVWDSLVKQQQVNSISNILIILIMFSAAYMMIARAYKIVGECEDIFEENTEAGMLTALSLITSAVGLLLLIINFQSIVTGFFNPEYGAAKEVLKLISNT